MSEQWNEGKEREHASDKQDNDEFSPIDEVAKATVLLAGTNKEYTIFHTYNSHTIEM